MCIRDSYKHGLTIRRSGSSALDIAYVAAGRLDAFWGNGMGIWDFAAGILIASESGALVSDFTGNPDCLDGDHILCAAPKCYKQMFKSIKSNFSPT